MSVKVNFLSEEEIRKIGDAFGNYNYAEGEYGMAFLEKDSTSVSNYISAYVRGTLKAGCLYSTSENHEGFIAMKRSDQKVNFEGGKEILKGIPRNVSFPNVGKVVKGYVKNKPGKSYKNMLDKLKIPYIYVSLVAVVEEYQGMGFMRPTLEIAFEEGRKHGLPVVLETDAIQKRDKYMHLGMICPETQRYVDGVELYSLVYEADSLPDAYTHEEVVERYEALTAKNKDVWDRFAPVYKYFVTSSPKNKRAYELMYRRIRKVVEGKEVLELATGPGVIAKEVADVTKSMIATDFSEKMLEQARQGVNPSNLIYEQADASDLKYKDNSFDVVIIANALHIIPNSENVLAEIKRVLKPKGVLIAPNFIHDSSNKTTNMWSGVLSKAGIVFETKWDEDSYREFISENGFRVVNTHVFNSLIPMMYTESVNRN